MSLIDNFSNQPKEMILAGALQPVFAFLPKMLIERWCRECGYSWRERIMGPVVTLLCCIRKQLDPQTSARDIEDWLASFLGDTIAKRDGHDFCDARSRLPGVIFQRACAHVAALASDAAAFTWCGFRVLIVDGTTHRAPRTVENIKEFGRSSSGTGLSVLPIVRLVSIVCAGCGAVVTQILGAYRESELKLFYAVLADLPRERLIIGDGGFNSFLTLWLIQQHHCHALCRADPTRGRVRECRLGYRDELHRWYRPSKWLSAFPEIVEQAPKEMLVRLIRRTIQKRGYRSWTLEICTTLVDPQKYQADELVMLYLDRWGVELDFRAVKQHLNLRRLTAKKPDIVRKEVLSGILAYNLVRATAAVAARGNQPTQISFERTRTLFVEYCARMSSAPTLLLPFLFKKLLSLVQQAILDPQIRPIEPRAILQHPTCYPFLRVSRKVWRKEQQHAS